MDNNSIEVILIALKDVKIYNTFRAEVQVSEGDTYKGTMVQVADGFKTVCINLLGVPTVYDYDVVTRYFSVTPQKVSSVGGLQK